METTKMPREERSLKEFPTGSSYEGSWDVLGISGYGTYTFPNGVIYEGYFEDGQFSGEGKYRYPNGSVLRGKFKDGKISGKKLTFADKLEYTECGWKYCRMPDRRYTTEYQQGLGPAGALSITAETPSREVPPGYYDTGDGFYHPGDKVVYKYNDLTAINRAPSKREIKWIIENCRTSADESYGPLPHLYEEWLQPELKLPVQPPPASLSRKLDMGFLEMVADISDSHIRTNDRSDIRIDSVKSSTNGCMSGSYAHISSVWTSVDSSVPIVSFGKASRDSTGSAAP